MSKELEALDELVYSGQENPITISFDITKFFQVIGEIRECLQRLEAIENTNPSEALEDLEIMYESYCMGYGINDERFKNIKQALIKSQEQEKENVRNEEILQKYYQDGITLDSVRTLKQERDNYKRVLDIIKEKCVSMWHLMKSKTVEDYNFYLIIEGIEDTNIFKLTQEEFELLKEML